GNDERSISITREIATSPSLIVCIVGPPACARPQAVARLGPRRARRARETSSAGAGLARAARPSPSSPWPCGEPAVARRDVLRPPGSGRRLDPAAGGSLSPGAAQPPVPPAP